LYCCRIIDLITSWSQPECLVESRAMLIIGMWGAATEQAKETKSVKISDT